jgi:hypothetical protein
MHCAGMRFDLLCVYTVLHMNYQSLQANYAIVVHETL